MTRVIIVYDVSDDARRNRLSKFLERMGLRRIQRSAYTGNLSTTRLKDVARGCEMIIDKNTDIIHIIPVGLQEWKKIIIIGTPLWAAGAPSHTIIEYS